MNQFSSAEYPLAHMQHLLWGLCSAGRDTLREERLLSTCEKLAPQVALVRAPRFEAEHAQYILEAKHLGHGFDCSGIICEWVYLPKGLAGGAEVDDTLRLHVDRHGLAKVCVVDRVVPHLWAGTAVQAAVCDALATHHQRAGGYCRETKAAPVQKHVADTPNLRRPCGGGSGGSGGY